MPADGHLELLATNEPWSRLPEETRAGVAAAFELTRHEDGTPTLRQGEANGSMHVVASGQMEVRIRSKGGPPRAVAMLGTGDCVDEMSILTGNLVS